MMPLAEHDDDESGRGPGREENGSPPSPLLLPPPAPVGRRVTSAGRRRRRTTNPRASSRPFSLSTFSAGGSSESDYSANPPSGPSIRGYRRRSTPQPQELEEGEGGGGGGGGGGGAAGGGLRVSTLFRGSVLMRRDSGEAASRASSEGSGTDLPFGSVAPPSSTSTARTSVLRGGRAGRSKGSTFVRFPIFSSAGTADEPESGPGPDARASLVASAGSDPTILAARNRIATHRRYCGGDYVLISNHEVTRDPAGTLVNRYGYPARTSGGTPSPSTAEERRGPYAYLLAQVASVHFGEDAQYYTVRRGDDKGEQRADAVNMEPIGEGGGLRAAKAAAARRQGLLEGGDGAEGADASREGPCWAPRCIRPCVDRLEGWHRRTRGGAKRLVKKVKRHSEMCLNGTRPYGISLRMTWVNYLVLCSVWYLYIDQLRLAFMPNTADFGCAVVSCIVWIILFLELVMEVFIRPDGYRKLLKSDKAYLPSTARHLTTFHLITEMISLIFFIPEFVCLFSKKHCGDRFAFSLENACIMSLYGPTRLEAFYGTAYICMLRLRIFGLVRHWTKMWINNTFVRVRGRDGEWHVRRGKGFLVPQGHWRGNSEEEVSAVMDERQSLVARDGQVGDKKKNEYTDDYHLTNASRIGTALFTTNAQRSLIFIFVIGLAPLIGVSLRTDGATNQQIWNSAELLNSNNLMLNATDDETCDQLQRTIYSWTHTNAFEEQVNGKIKLHILSLEIEPRRCGFQYPDADNVSALTELASGPLNFMDCINSTRLDICKNVMPVEDCRNLCMGWSQSNETTRLELLELYFDVRPATTVSVEATNPSTYSDPNGEIVSAEFSVRVLYNEALSVRRVIIYLFTMQLSMTLLVILGLSVMRYDAGRLVLGPLRRMLKIVAFYAKNPLSPPPQEIDKTSSTRTSFQLQNEAYYDSDDDTSDKQLGTFETEELINAVTKISDLLRKCWGVAGADIISTNLARQEGGLASNFNPTVPGKAVYAIFAFVYIDNWQRHLHALKGDIMILINDIAAVLHSEVYRWGYGERGQCNKNLGAAFLMVFKIGSVSDVLEKREMAEAVIFSEKHAHTSKARRRKSRNPHAIASTHFRMSSLGSQTVMADADKYSRSHVDSLDLSSLPGMRKFTDLALLGLLKTLCGIHRDDTIKKWNDDFRLGAGVGASSISLRFGMDAGWAQEGAVGSSYKIDATYLSPHVNMASRMCSATKQYGVYILLSQKVQELLSEEAKEHLRHIDTVTVKGSSVQQKIFTYDSRVRGDIFLYRKTESQADLDAARYTPAIWNRDQDLVAMRSHICDEFLEAFNRGRDEYLAGNWQEAIRLLRSADKIMFECEVDGGYSDKSYNTFGKSLTNLYAENGGEAEERLNMGDGPCQSLLRYMSGMDGTPPSSWRGYRPLTNK